MFGLFNKTPRAKPEPVKLNSKLGTIVYTLKETNSEVEGLTFDGHVSTWFDGRPKVIWTGAARAHEYLREKRTFVKLADGTYVNADSVLSARVEVTDDYQEIQD